MGQDDAGVSVTYWMNKLQSLDNRQPLFVSVNPVSEPVTNAVYRSFNYQHPFFDLASWQAQKFQTVFHVPLPLQRHGMFG